MSAMGTIVDLADAEWELVADLFDPDGRRGAPEHYPRRTMVEAMLWMARTGVQHPDEFGAEISFSGYFQAGAVGVNSGRPFGGDQALLAADSPSVVAPGLPAGERGALYFVLIAEPSQSFYGPQATAFAQTITQAGYPHTLVAAALPHGWSQVRAEFPIAAQLIAQWEVARGVFA
jgi:hypothetical protein